MHCRKCLHPENCFIIIFARRTFRISKLPHRVTTWSGHEGQRSEVNTEPLPLTPCWQRSRESSLMRVVLPVPVAPVKMVSSPERCPFRACVNLGNLCHCTCVHLFVSIEGFLRYLSTLYTPSLSLHFHCIVLRVEEQYSKQRALSVCSVPVPAVRLALWAGRRLVRDEVLV